MTRLGKPVPLLLVLPIATVLTIFSGLYSLTVAGTLCYVIGLRGLICAGRRSAFLRGLALGLFWLGLTFVPIVQHAAVAPWGFDVHRHCFWTFYHDH